MIKRLLLTLLIVFVSANVYASQTTTNYEFVIPGEGERNWLPTISRDIISIDKILGILSEDTGTEKIGIISEDVQILQTDVTIISNDLNNYTGPMIIVSGDVADLTNLTTIISNDTNNYTGPMIIVSSDVATLTTAQNIISDDLNNYTGPLVTVSADIVILDNRVDIVSSDAVTWDAHLTNNGSDHSYIDQSVISGSTPTFTATNITGVPAASLLAGTVGAGTYVIDVITADGISTDTINFRGNQFSEDAPTDNYIFVFDVATNNYELEAQGAAGGILIDIDSVVSNDIVQGVTDAIIPLDDTVPTNTEGTEFMTITVQAAEADNEFVIEHNGNYSVTTSGNLAVALYKDSGAAIAVTATKVSAGTDYVTMSLRHVVTTGDTNSQTYAIRTGNSAAGGNTITMNGATSNRIYGGVSCSTLVISEYNV